MSTTAHALSTLGPRILADVALGQSTADAIAQRIRIPTQLCENLCDALVAENKLQTFTVAEVLTVYRLR